MQFLIYLLVGYLFIYLQFIVVPSFSILGIIPNILISYIIFISMRLELKKLAPISLLIGLAYDIYYPETFGLTSLVFLIISTAINSQHEKINKFKFSMVLIFVFIINLIFLILYSAFNFSNIFAAEHLISNLSISLIYNFIVSSILIYTLELISRLRIYLSL